VRYVIDELNSLVHTRDGHSKIFAMIEAYLDESGIHDGAKVCVISGYFGGKGQMRKLERGWRAVLNEFGFPMTEFHAKDLVKSRKDYPMLVELARAIAAQPKVHPVSYGIIVDDFNSFSFDERQFMTGATLHPRTGKLLTSGCPTRPYFVPFQNIVKLVCDHAPVGGRAHFSFGLDTSFSQFALVLFKQIEEQSKLHPRPWSAWDSVDRLGMAQFPLASETPELQAADLLVHLTYQHMNDWMGHGKVSTPSEILRMCLANYVSREDHKYQDRECLETLLSNARRLVPAWDRRLAGRGANQLPQSPLSETSN